MKTIKRYHYLLLFALLAIPFSCKQGNAAKDPLPSWNETPQKHAIISFMDSAVKVIPDSDRIAVFDMDGTIACETPLWFEMYAAVNGLNQQSKANPDLLKQPEYQYARKLAKNPADTSATNHWNIDSMVWKAYAGMDNEAYVDSARAYLSRTKNTKYNITLSRMFYQPMLELIQYLKDNHFSVYIVSGSVQGVIWSVCPQTIGLNRAHLIGTRQILSPTYNPKAKKTSFIIQKGIYSPQNNKDGKSIDIYTQLGKTPVFAFGNTVGDFGMLHFASTSKYPHAAFLLNHDDAAREYAYKPYYTKDTIYWRDSLRINGWHLVNMSKDFKTVWMKK
jgi:phosphoglycolate phosphatase-like HAD superfamily hydrolase